MLHGVLLCSAVGGWNGADHSGGAKCVQPLDAWRDWSQVLSRRLVDRVESRPSYKTHGCVGCRNGSLPACWGTGESVMSTTTNIHPVLIDEKSK